MPYLAYKARPRGTAKYNSKERRDMSRPNLRNLFLGIILARSMETSITGGTKMVNTRNIRLIEVYMTAVLAHILDLP